MGAVPRDAKKLKKENTRLREQNNALQAKVDLLVDMVSSSALWPLS